MRVIVTGASRGLGLALATSMLHEGHHVIAICRSAISSSETASHPSLRSYFGDVTDDEFVKEVMRQEPGCDVLINNAGVAFDGIIATQSLNSVDQLLDTNLRSAIVTSKFFVRSHLRENSAGCIINISSIIAIRGYAGLAVYSATKAGLIGLTQSMARELGPRGFRVNAVLPGYFDSEMSERLRPEQRRQIIRRTPLGRLASVGDVVPAVMFLSSPAASFVTGQSLVVDGGITC